MEPVMKLVTSLKAGLGQYDFDYTFCKYNWIYMFFFRVSNLELKYPVRGTGLVRNKPVYTFKKSRWKINGNEGGIFKTDKN